MEMTSGGRMGTASPIASRCVPRHVLHSLPCLLWADEGGGSRSRHGSENVSGLVQRPFCLASKPKHGDELGVCSLHSMCVCLFPAQYESCPSWGWPSPEGPVGPQEPTCMSPEAFLSSPTSSTSEASPSQPTQRCSASTGTPTSPRTTRRPTSCSRGCC